MNGPKKNLQKIAQDAVSLSPLMAGREQATTDDLLGQIISITEIDFATITDKSGEQKTFPVVLYKEDPAKYYNGGHVLKKICESWVAAYDGDVDELNADLNEYPVSVKLSMGRTKNSGQNLVKVEVMP